MPRQIERWGAIPSLTYWNEQLQILHEFAEHRPRYVLQHLQETLGLEPAELMVEVSDPNAGYITVHDVRVPVPAFAGTWLKGIPLRLQAHAQPGWRFVRWEGRFPSELNLLSITMTDPTVMLAVFEPDD
jgi:hypothetical protein